MTSKESSLLKRVANVFDEILTHSTRNRIFDIFRTAESFANVQSMDLAKQSASP